MLHVVDPVCPLYMVRNLCLLKVNLTLGAKPHALNDLSLIGAYDFGSEVLHQS